MKRTLERLLDGRDLDEQEACDLLVTLAVTHVPAASAGAVLAALRAKGETGAEVRGFAAALRALATRPELHGIERAVDVVGTGGDGSGSLNLSTGSALLAAACGVPVVKHGNRAQSSRCGSADVLEALGYVLPRDAAEARESFERSGFTFLHAPTFQPALRALGEVRRALGVRTVLNLLGPLTNPAAPPFAVIGAYSRSAAALLADALTGMAVERAFVIHGALGWDEATPVGPFVLLDVRCLEVRRTERDPARHGIRRCAPEALLGGDAVQNATRLTRALHGESGALADALVLGAALALEVSGAVARFDEGIDRARTALHDGSAGRLLDVLIEPSVRREAADA